MAYFVYYIIAQNHLNHIWGGGIYIIFIEIKARIKLYSSLIKTFSISEENNHVNKRPAHRQGIVMCIG